MMLKGIYSYHSHLFQDVSKRCMKTEYSTCVEFSILGVKKLVAQTDKVSSRSSVPSTQGHHLTIKNSMGSFLAPSHETPALVDFCEFVDTTLKKSKLSTSQSRHIATHAWRKMTQEGLTSYVRKWIDFCDMYQHHYFKFPFDKILLFLEYLKNQKHHYSMIRGGCRIACLGQSLLGQPLNAAESTILDKFLIACFNDNPPINRKLAETWDVSVLLDYFMKMGPNESLSFSDISGKLLLLLLLTQMCRSTEVLQ